MASLFLLASLSILAMCWCCHADLIADVCAQSRAISPSTCALILRSDPHSRGADLKSLGQIVIKKAKFATRNTAIVARSVADLNNTLAVRECVSVCGEAVDSLKDISKTLKNFDKRNMTDLVMTLSATGGYVDTCYTGFAERSEGVPAEVTEACKIAQGLIIVLGIIVRNVIN